MRLIALVCVIGSLTFGVFLFFKAGAMVDRMQSRIYILSAGKAFAAFAADRQPNLPVEAKATVKDFHNDFFTLDPDEKVIDANLTSALYLADGSAKKVYDNLKESNYFSDVISANISQRVAIDSISLDLRMVPFYFRLYATLTIKRTTSVATRSLVTEGYLREVERSDNNTHGLLIERWSILENHDLKVENR
jgi:conjugative transposon TraK protein